MVDESSRHLIERAAAHLRGRSQQNVVSLTQDWAPQQTAAATASAAAATIPHPAPARPAEPRRPAGQAVPTRSREVTIDRSALARAGIAIPSSQRSRVVEEFRIIKRQVVAKFVQDAAADSAAHRNRVIMVTSARPGEGKTFTAINLALALASEQDLKVLLIDLDTKHHAIQEMMGISADRGLIDLMADPAIDFPDVILRTNLPNLTIMPAGNPHIRIPELLSSRRTRGLLDEMARRYADRFIIFDAPPCLASSDPAILAALVGQVVFVVEADHTQQEEIETALSLISACPNINLLLNKVRASAVDQFGSYTDY